MPTLKRLSLLVAIKCLLICANVIAAGNAEQRDVRKLLPTISYMLLDDDTLPPIELSPDAGKHLARPLSGEPGAAPFGYYVYLPEDHTLDSRRKSPLLLFLHGQGEIGNGTTQLNAVLRNGPPKMIERGENIPAVVVSPQLAIGSWQKQNNGFDIPADLNALVSLIVTRFNIDTNRIYVTGLSLGGGGAWNYARLYPNQVAAVVPVCGVGTNGVNLDALSEIGVWAFHALGDQRVSSRNSVRNINRVVGTVIDTPTGVMENYPDNGQDNVVSRVGNNWVWRPGRYDATGKTRYTVFPDNSHNAWSRAYNQQGAPDTPMWQWLFAQSRQTSTTN